MPKLTIFDTNNPLKPIQVTQDVKLITAKLAQVGINFEIWPTLKTNTQSNILETYQEQIKNILSTYHFQSVDVINVNHNTPDLSNLRKKFLDEHIHTEDEVRFFVQGSGLFSLHIHNKIFAILCETGCFLAVPAGVKHWFDFGAQPNVTAIRFFTNTQGWLAQYTGNQIANKFPRLGEKLSGLKIKAIVVDIEGTIAPTDFVYNTLFPYARKNLPEYIRKHYPPENTNKIIKQMLAWMDTDQKITELKTLQGLIWQEGFEKAELSAPLYFDAYIQLNNWFTLNIPIYCYSSGSINAQKLFYKHNEHGDLSYLFTQYFDTTIGNKLEAKSYISIAAQIQQNLQDILFFSDNPEELIAAKKAGWQCILVNRTTARNDTKHNFLTIDDFRDIDII